MAASARKFLVVAGLVAAACVGGQMAMVSPPAQAQGSENFSADNCVSGRQVESRYIYDNTCIQPVNVVYCTQSPNRDCKAAAHYFATAIAANSSSTIYPPSDTQSIKRITCTARGEHYWVDSLGGFRCRAGAAASAEIRRAEDNFGAYEASIWSGRAVDLSSPRTGRCTALINHGALGLDANGARFVKERYGSGSVAQVTWSGVCDADGLISGSGTLSITVVGGPDVLDKKFIGTADRGLLVGNAAYDRDSGGTGPPEPIRFDNGCNNWNGARPNTCDTAFGAKLRERYMATFAGAKPAPAGAALPQSTRAIAPGQIQSGRITADDPPWSDGTNHDCWAFDAPAGRYLAKLRTSAFDAIVSVGRGHDCRRGFVSNSLSNVVPAPPTGGVVDFEFDADGGPWFVAVSTYGHGDNGNYTLVLEPKN